MLEPPHGSLYCAIMARRSSRSPHGRQMSKIERKFWSYLRFGPRRRRSDEKDTDDGGVPVEPNRPNTLSGGAAAELEFDD
jgi:hypothetical protein